MNKIWIIARREYKAYFSSPVAYLVAAFVLLVIGIIFGLTVYFVTLQPGSPPPSVDQIVGTMATMFVWTLPAITMRLLSDETRLGTIELLLTAPVKDWEVVVGKWLGSWLFVLTMMAITLLYPIFMQAMIEPGIDQGLIVTGYLALALMSGALLAIGVLVSSLFSSPAATALATLAVFVVAWFLVGPMGNIGSGAFSEVIRYIDLRGHFNTMVRGVIELTGVVYYISLTAFFLLLSSVSLESRRWR
jgi:ABC-2 type transport system permease protein